MWTPLVQQTKENDRVGILGLGGLGHMAIKFASALGRRVTAGAIETTALMIPSFFLPNKAKCISKFSFFSARFWKNY